MILLIDNYDSFTYNLAQYIGTQTSRLEVVRNDQISIDEIRELDPEKIVISPGPGRPENAGILVEVLQKISPEVPTLGICLGHQAIATAYGGKVIRAPQIIHGKTSTIRHNEDGVFRNIPTPFQATRYHSLLVERESLPESLRITATTEEDNLIMGMEHTDYPICGMQFHPESIITEHGMQLVTNFIEAEI
ncbi:MAG: aminodeoxychorismate/anthranilate synthase component II [Candidatus Marinimicrobia bacterium]|nr:aminodeoxychorismate/anthranilate synthase component II [Candidatus Neomarinimicrobiota bacterium]MCF7828239.1 aminodeoxychorismate/anthranilate synthase component II [Candidatus Neomarinimicrobiota bacterium]MCF7879586.1 aminodeoxychorismate/anthranilate synthase component II [Candidatus Neomarinimicrobiota bacterium]